jgi:flavin reductase (DIM6/NTAB) family NADH-FMN oxidoreductase RutF/rubrerythrin
MMAHLPKMQITQGLYVLGLKDSENRNTGCVVTSLTQIEASPETIVISTRKNSYTSQNLCFDTPVTVSILSKNCNPEVIKNLGYRKGYETTKWDSIESDYFHNMPVLTGKDANGCLYGKVCGRMEFRTHCLWFIEITDSIILSTEEPMTLQYFLDELEDQIKESLARGEEIPLSDTAAVEITEDETELALPDADQITSEETVPAAADSSAGSEQELTSASESVENQDIPEELLQAQPDKNSPAVSDISADEDGQAVTAGNEDITDNTDPGTAVLSENEDAAAVLADIDTGSDTGATVAPDAESDAGNEPSVREGNDGFNDDTPDGLTGSEFLTAKTDADQEISGNNGLTPPNQADFTAAIRSALLRSNEEDSEGNETEEEPNLNLSAETSEDAGSMSGGFDDIESILASDDHEEADVNDLHEEIRNDIPKNPDQSKLDDLNLLFGPENSDKSEKQSSGTAETSEQEISSSQIKDRGNRFVSPSNFTFTVVEDEQENRNAGTADELVTPPEKSVTRQEPDAGDLFFSENETDLSLNDKSEKTAADFRTASEDDEKAGDSHHDFRDVLNQKINDAEQKTPARTGSGRAPSIASLAPKVVSTPPVVSFFSSTYYCPICKYEYHGRLPANFVCPVCGFSGTEFEIKE